MKREKRKREASTITPAETRPQRLVHNRIVATGPPSQRPQSDRLFREDLRWVVWGEGEKKGERREVEGDYIYSNRPGGEKSDGM